MSPMNARLLRPTASGKFDPRRIAGLGLWLDAADASTITLNGTTVSQWRDKSSRGLHAAQATALSQPTYTPSGLNAKPVITFSSRILETPPLLMGQTAFVVASRSALNHPVAEHGGAFFRGLWGSSYPSFTTHLNYGINGNAPAAAAPNSVTVGPTIMTQTVANDPTLLSSLGIGKGTPSFAPLNGYVAELVIFDTVLPLDSIQRMQGYLAHKWGLSANLPANHPFKNNAP